MSHEKSNKRNKPAGHISVFRALVQGARGEQLDDTRASRRVRMARALGDALAGYPQSASKEAAAHQAEIMHKFNMTKESAKGANKEVMQLLERAAKLPVDLPSNVIIEPLNASPVLRINEQTNRRLTDDSSLMYSRSFVVNNAQAKKDGVTPVQLYTADGKPLTVTVETGWNPLPIQINTIDISYTAPVTVAGPRYGEVVTSASAGQARITINQQPYDPEKRREYTGSGRDTRVNEDGTFDGQLSFLLSTDGTKFDEVVMGRNNQNSMQPVDASNISVEDLLRDLGRAMFETEHMLQVPDDLSSLQNV